MKYVEVYGREVKEYSNIPFGTGEQNKLAWLDKATNVCISQAVNGDYTLSLTLPKEDPKWAFIAEERQLGYNGKAFRIKEIDGENIKAITLIQDACRTHIQALPDMINQSVTDVIVPTIFDKRKCPYVNALSASELRARGFTPVTVNFDFFEVSKKTPIGCLNMLMESLQKYKVNA